MNKVSIRFFDDREVRAIWDEENSKWRFSVLDIIAVLTNQDDYNKTRNYWKYLKAKLKKENNQVVFQVIDNGKGIDKRYQSKVFDKYFQIPGSNKSGTGLGLAISKEFIEAQNGTISVESELGLGSTFSIGLNWV